MTRISETLPEGIGLYIHIPFCETKCPYCDFNTYAGIEDLISQYTAALTREIDLCGNILGGPVVNTVFLGGGTPSYLPSPNASSVLEAVRAGFPMRDGAEVTLESNPGDLNAKKLEAYLNTGINRLSIGFQSLKDELLQVLGRRHTAKEAIEAYKLAREVGFTNVNIDLMYGLPYQRMSDWRRTLEGVLDLKPEHLSMYCLTLEDGTPMERQVRLGILPVPDPDLAADMYIMAEEMLADAGLRHYEISNWAVPGLESQHNLIYWHNRPYLGVGPGAHSYLLNHRFNNLKSPREYIKRLSIPHVSLPPFSSDCSGEIIYRMSTVQDVELVDQGLEMAETLMMGLRLHEGINLDDFHRRFNIGLEEVYGREVEELTSLGLVTIEDGALRLMPRGRLLGNEVFQRFVSKESGARKITEQAMRQAQDKAV